MDIDSILTTLESCGHHGAIISTEESIVLYNSLLLLQNENHFRKIYFWGRILGSDKDYYIVYGYVKDALTGRIFYYSTNCTDWGLLPKPNENGLLLTPLCTTKFQGDPALVIDILVEKDEIIKKLKDDAPKVVQLKEEDRLSATVYFINQEAVAVPRGALFKRPDGVVVENLSFEGLTPLDAQELCSFLHYREPLQKWNTNLLVRHDYNYAMDFLDTLDTDIPEGCWSMQVVSGGKVVVLKSLYWPGVLIYQYIGTPKYGYIYIGNGKRVLDVPFQLCPF